MYFYGYRKKAEVKGYQMFKSILCGFWLIDGVFFFVLFCVFSKFFTQNMGYFYSQKKYSFDYLIFNMLFILFYLNH